MLEGDNDRYIRILENAWPAIVGECRAVLGGELHYQAVIYHCLRTAGVPQDQIGMNVKQWFDNPVSANFQERGLRQHPDFRGGFEPIPDIVLFSPGIKGDWRRRNYAETIKHTSMAIEVKASERAGGRLRYGEVADDIRKLSSQREEMRHLGYDMIPVMLVIDTAPLAVEQMTAIARQESQEFARAQRVGWLYVNQTEDFCNLP